MTNFIHHINQNWVRYKIGVAILLFVSLFTFISFKSTQWCLYRNFFALDSVHIEGNSLVADNHIIKTGNLHHGMNLFNTDCKAIRNNLETHPYVIAAIVSKRYPNKMMIQIRERVPLAYLNTGELYFIDRDGVVLPKTSHNIADMLAITIAPDTAYNVSMGEKLHSPQIKKIIDLVIKTHSMSRPLFNSLSEIRFDIPKNQLTLFNKETGNPIYFGRQDFEKKMAYLAKFQRLLAGKKRLRDYQYIDLRWKEQIVVKEI